MTALKHWAGKAIECSELSGLFCSCLEEKNSESNADEEAWLVKSQRKVGESFKCSISTVQQFELIIEFLVSWS